jgi:hypothetical protein
MFGKNKKTTTRKAFAYGMLIAGIFLAASNVSLDLPVHRFLSEYDDVHTSFSDLQKLQVRNYVNGTGLLLNFHITHHAGTAFCSWARANGPVPDFACMGGKNYSDEVYDLLVRYPWSAQDTDRNIQTLRQQFHYVSWEKGPNSRAVPLNNTDWENPDLVSIVVMRDPMQRLMSDVGAHFVKHGTEHEWWEYANQYHTDNYALATIMNGKGRCTGSNTSQAFVSDAKAFLERFTFIIDQECLDESLDVLSSILHLKHKRSTMRHVVKPRARERVNNAVLYKYLMDRNASDIELYEWAASQALVKCKRTSPIVDLPTNVQDQ